MTEEFWLATVAWHTKGAALPIERATLILLRKGKVVSKPLVARMLFLGSDTGFPLGPYGHRFLAYPEPMEFDEIALLDDAGDKIHYAKIGRRRLEVGEVYFLAGIEQRFNGENRLRFLLF